MQEVFEFSGEQAHRLLEQPGRASLVDAGEHMHVTLMWPAARGASPSSVPSSACRPELGRDLSRGGD